MIRLALLGILTGVVLGEAGYVFGRTGRETAVVLLTLLIVALLADRGYDDRGH